MLSGEIAPKNNHYYYYSWEPDAIEHDKLFLKKIAYVCKR